MIDDTLTRYTQAYTEAFNEIDPHTNYKSSYDGQKAVHERSLEIEKEAKASLRELLLSKKKEALIEVGKPGAYLVSQAIPIEAIEELFGGSDV